MFSSRTPARFEANRLTLALAARRAAGLPVADATESNPTRCGFPYPPELLEALRDPRSLAYAPAPAGLEEARAGAAAWHAARGAALQPDDIVLASSTSEAYSWLFKLLCEPGDEVLVPRPSYPLFDCLAELEGVRVKAYPLVREEGWAFDFEALATLTGPRTRALIAVHPNNPTGSYVKTREAGALAAFCAARGLALISDEVFWDFSYAPDPRRAGSLAGLTEGLVFSLNGLSKMAGLPQMKLGWIALGGDAALRAAARERLEWIADAYLPVSAPVQHAAARWLDLAPAMTARILDRVRANRTRLAAVLPAGAGCRLMGAEGGWCGLVETPRFWSDEEWALRLLDRGVLVQPGYFYDFEYEGCLAVSLLAPGEVVEKAGESINKLIQPAALERAAPGR
jgi:aspartate/methionine/tyrosine aminotransferase